MSTPAHDLLLKSGWRQRSYGTADTGYCILGALWEAYLDVDERGLSWRQVKDAIRRVQAARGEEEIDPQADRESLASWNDAPGRTQAEVLGLLTLAGV